ncbi:MAG: carboxypeptidase regulatory-like domain-containing protein [Planctomycetes bacterium]|nr:carboxypeptidase regulatory-like domain-containing protein [Planctomycetota bacterium]
MRRTLLRALAPFVVAGLAAPTTAQDASPAVVGYRLSGRVTELDGAPLAAARLATAAGEIAKCDGDGRFTCDLAIGGASELSAATQLYVVAEGRASFRIPLRPLLHRAARANAIGTYAVDLGELRLPIGVTFRGRVRDPDGAPLAGVAVTANDELCGQEIWTASFGSRTVTDARGRFELAGVFGEAMRLAFERDGYYRTVVRGAGIGTPLDIALEPSGFVSGALPALDGAPFAGELYLLSEFPGESWERVSVQGASYRLGVATRGRFRVVALGTGNSIGWQSEVLAGPRDGVALAPVGNSDRGAVIRAVDAATGAPLTEVRCAGRRWPGDELPDVLRNDLLERVHRSPPAAAPRLPVDTGAGALWLAVTAAGYLPALQRLEEGAGEELKIALEAARSLRGRVVDAAGTALADVPVEWEGERGARLPRKGVVRTAADGSFVIAGLGNEVARLSVARSPLAPVVRSRVDLTAVGPVDDVELVLSGGVVVAGKVTGLGAGAAARIALRPARAPSTDTWTATLELPASPGVAGLVTSTIAADGSFEFAECGNGERVLELFVPVPPRCGPPVRVPLHSFRIDGAPGALALDAADAVPGEIAGHLRLSGAEVPAGRLAVIAAPAQPPSDWSERRAAMHWRLVAGDGAFALSLPPGTFQLQVRDCVTGIALLRAGDEPEVEVGPGAREQLDLRVAVVAAAVTFTVAGGGPTLVDHLEVDLESGRGLRFSGGPLPFGGGTYGSPGVYVEGRSGPARFFVPPGPVFLKVGGATRIDAGSIHFGNTRAELAVEAEPGKPLEVEVELGPAADLGGK